MKKVIPILSLLCSTNVAIYFMYTYLQAKALQMVKLKWKMLTQHSTSQRTNFDGVKLKTRKKNYKLKI